MPILCFNFNLSVKIYRSIDIKTYHDKSAGKQDAMRGMADGVKSGMNPVGEKMRRQAGLPPHKMYGCCGYSLSRRIFIISHADLATDVPGPNMAATPAW